MHDATSKANTRPMHMLLTRSASYRFDSPRSDTLRAENKLNHHDKRFGRKWISVITLVSAIPNRVRRKKSRSAADLGETKWDFGYTTEIVNGLMQSREDCSPGL